MCNAFCNNNALFSARSTIDNIMTNDLWFFIKLLSALASFRKKRNIGKERLEKKLCKRNSAKETTNFKGSKSKTKLLFPCWRKPHRNQTN